MHKIDPELHQQLLENAPKTKSLHGVGSPLVKSPGTNDVAAYAQRLLADDIEELPEPVRLKRTQSFYDIEYAGNYLHAAFKSQDLLDQAKYIETVTKSEADKEIQFITGWPTAYDNSNKQ